MIRSMTGFGRADFEVMGVEFAVEARTVNHRHLDTRVRLPRLMADREHEVKSLVQGRFKRGKVDLTVSLASEAGAVTQLEVDRDAVEQYVTAARDIAETHGLPDALDAATVLSLPGVVRLVERQMPEGALNEALLGAVDEVLDAVERMRVSEGEALAREFASRLEGVERLLNDLESRSGRVVEGVKEKLRKRATQLELETGLLDEARLHQEVVVAADRLDIVEEIVRTRSHVDQFRAILLEAGPGSPWGDALSSCCRRWGERPTPSAPRRTTPSSRTGSWSSRPSSSAFVSRFRILSSGGGPSGSGKGAAREAVAAPLPLMLNIGYGNLVIASRVIAVVSPQSSPMRRLRDEAGSRGKLIDATQGRRTRSIIVTDSDHVILSAINPETIASRLFPEEAAGGGS
jgi:uncharacterized protein (TIGR00255 family)